MNILVTGAAGFIGSHYVLRHVTSNPEDKIVVVDNLNYAADKSLLDPIIDKITFYEEDIASSEKMQAICKEHHIETIVNFAAETHVDKSIEDEAPFLATNILGVQSFIDVCKNEPATLFLHVSTDEVYGDLTDDDPVFTVDTPLRPSSPYSASKAAGDLLLLAAVRTFGIRGRITRCTNNYGPHQDSTKLIPVIINQALKDEPIPIYGEGKQKRDWLYVTDHTDAVELVLERGSDGQVYLISADDEKENIEVTRLVLEKLGKSEDLIDFVPDRPGHDWRYQLDAANTKALGWKARVGFEQGLEQTIDWFKGTT